MTAIAVPCPFPGSERIHERLRADTDLEPNEVTRLIRAVCRDTIRAAERSGGEPFVVPVDVASEVPDWGDPRKTAQSLVASVSDDDSAFPVAPTVSADEEWTVAVFELAQERSDAASLGILAPVSPLVGRRHLDAAAMRLRTNDVVVGPSSRTTWYFLGIDREYAYDGHGRSLDYRSVTAGVDRDETSAATMPFLPGYCSGTELESLRALIDLTAATGEDVHGDTRQWFHGRTIGVDSASTDDPNCP